MGVYLEIVLLLLTGFVTCNGQRCDNSQFRNCREVCQRESQRRGGELSVTDCSKFRESFDCFIDQTILCARDDDEKERYGREILDAASSLRKCDEVEGWTRNRCFEKDEIKRCEEMLPRRLSVANQENCRKYEEFRDCVERIINNYCSSSDRSYLKTYYVDIVRDFPWRCSSTSHSISPTRYPGSQYPYNSPSGYGNRTINEQICCRSEYCGDRDRLLNCRQDLIQIMEGRSNQRYDDNRQQCTTLLNKFNCFLWHTYNCQDSYDKDTQNLKRARRYIEEKCDVFGDLRNSRCYQDIDKGDCERHLQEETSSKMDVTCREYASYSDCIEQQVRRCNPQDELLQGIYLMKKVDDKAWTCSKKVATSGGYDQHGSTYPHNTYDPSMSDDQDCEARARRKDRTCSEDWKKREEEVRRTHDNRERNRLSCCSVYSLRECVRQLTREECGREKTKVVEAIMGFSMVQRINQCQDIDQSTCSASQMLSNTMIIILTVAILRSIFQ